MGKVGHQVSLQGRKNPQNHEGADLGLHLVDQPHLSPILTLPPSSTCQSPLLTCQHALSRPRLSAKTQQEHMKLELCKCNAELVWGTLKPLNQVKQVEGTETPSDLRVSDSLMSCHQGIVLFTYWSVSMVLSCFPHMTWPTPPIWTVTGYTT